MFQLSKSVQAVVAGEGLSTEQLETMVVKAALFSHDRGNRRYHDWVFRVIGNIVESMTRVECRTVSRSGSTAMTVYEDCPQCTALGCRDCHWIGEVKVQYC
jgi:hypothetical protein